MQPLHTGTSSRRAVILGAAGGNSPTTLPVAADKLLSTHNQFANLCTSHLDQENTDADFFAYAFTIYVLIVDIVQLWPVES